LRIIVIIVVDRVQSTMALQTLPRGCADHYQNGHTENGKYVIIRENSVREIYCYMDGHPWNADVSLQFSILFLLYANIIR